MNADSEKARLSVLGAPQSRRGLSIRLVKERLRRIVLEGRVWREFLDAESLTINGNIVWKENRQQVGVYVRKGKKTRSIPANPSRTLPLLDRELS